MSMEATSPADPGSRDLVASKWSVTEPDVAHLFFGFPPLRPHLIERAYGPELARAHRDNPRWAEDILVDRYLAGKPIRSMLSLCCGFGVVELQIMTRSPGIQECLGLDIAEGALAEARTRAAAAGLGTRIRYAAADLNRYEWPDARYDLIVANGALHHLANLEEVVAGMRRALRPGGVIYASEHVGAQHQDYPPRQFELINAAAFLVPPELRSRRPAAALPFKPASPLLRYLNRLVAEAHAGGAAPGRLAALARRITRNPVRRFGVVHASRREALLRTDPSEGVSSHKIVPTLRTVFPDIEVRSYGGGILAYALDAAFFANYRDDVPLHRETLEMLCRLETWLEESGQIGMEHAILVGTKTA